MLRGKDCPDNPSAWIRFAFDVFAAQPSETQKAPVLPGPKNLCIKQGPVPMSYERLSSMAFCSIWSAVVTTLLFD